MTRNNRINTTFGILITGMHIDRVIPLKISSTVLRLTETNIVIKLMPQLLTVKLSYAVNVLKCIS